MVRFLLRHGMVRFIGGRAVPVMVVWDVVVMANRARRIPVVDRGLRRGVGTARRGFGAALATHGPISRFAAGPAAARATADRRPTDTC